MKIPGIVISAPRSGSGKTLITISLMKALTKAGKKVRAFKCGPDYIDPLFHSKILGIPSKNLDLFFTDEEQTKKLFTQENDGDISVVEGVMGLYDGMHAGSSEASSYHMASVLGLPVVLVIDAKGMSYSILAEIAGFISMDSEKLIKGIVLNNMSQKIYGTLKPEIENRFGVKVLGYFQHQKEIQLESRYLGLKLPSEIADIQKMTEKAAEEIEKTVDIKALLELAQQVPDCESNTKSEPQSVKNKIRIAIARDEAFCFYYEDNLKLLEKYGAELISFSPVHDKFLPENISGLILGGGYPELFAAELEQNDKMKEAVKSAISNGIPSLAECGGFMYLHDSIKTPDGNFYKMCGIIDGECEYKGKLVRFGYITVTNKKSNMKIKGHEFHYYDSSSNGTDCSAVKPKTEVSWDCCFATENHWWGFPHLYYPSNPEFVRTFMTECFEFNKAKEEF